MAINDIPPVPQGLENRPLIRFLNDLRSKVQEIVIGTGTVTSVTATTPIVVTPSPLTTTGVVSHADSGVTAATYGDATHVAQVAVDAKGHVTAASSIAITGGGTVTSIAATAPISVSPSPIVGTGTITHDASGVVASTYGDSTHVPQIAVDAKGHVTSASSVAIVGGTVTSISATSPIVVSPSPITGTGTVTHANSGVTAATYGNARLTVNATGHITSATEAFYSVTSATTITLDLNNGPNQALNTLAHNATFAAVSNAVDGSIITLVIKQDGTGSRTATWNSVFLFVNGSKTLSTAANSVDVVSMVYCGPLSKWVCVLAPNAS